MFEEESWLSAEDRMALDNIERFDSYSDLDDYERRLQEEAAASRWDDDVDEDEFEEDDGFLEFEDDGDIDDEDW